MPSISRGRAGTFMVTADILLREILGDGSLVVGGCSFTVMGRSQNNTNRRCVFCLAEYRNAIWYLECIYLDQVAGYVQRGYW